MPRLKISVMTLEPSLWRTLPKELLHLVFARLPVVGFGQLRVLSKEWKRNVDCNNSEFNRVFNVTTHLNMFALQSWRSLDAMSDSCIIYDMHANKWHVNKTNVVTGNMDGADGGLVCFILHWAWYNYNPGIFIVMNPLTRQKLQLPPLLRTDAEKSNTLITKVKIVKLTMDRKTKEYKVFVLRSIRNGGGGFFAQVYDSRIKEWTVVEATYGYIIEWNYLVFKSNFGIPFGLCVYNCADGTLQQFNETNITPGLEVNADCWALIEDHLFVLHKETSPRSRDVLEDGASMLQKYCTSEFHLLEKTTAWVKLRVYSCDPCKCFCDSPQDFINSKLWGCNGFLLVYGVGFKQAWLFNLSTCEWRKLPAFVQPFNPSTMNEISWSSIA